MSVGRPKLEIDADEVERMASIYCSTEEIAYIVGCSRDTIENRFSAEIARGRAKGREKLRRLQWKCAEKGVPQMLIFLGKQILKQTDQQEITVTNAETEKQIDEMKEKLRVLLSDDG